MVKGSFCLIQGGLWGLEALQKLPSETHNSKRKVIWKSFELDINASQACNNYQITVAYIMFHCKIAEPELKGNL